MPIIVVIIAPTPIVTSVELPGGWMGNPPLVVDVGDGNTICVGMVVGCVTPVVGVGNAKRVGVGEIVVVSLGVIVADGVAVWLTCDP